jgi:uncharacterized protein
MKTEIPTVVDALVEAMTSYDVEAMRELCAPEMRHWLSITEQEQGLDGLLATFSKERSVTAESTFDVRRRVETADGAVLMLTVDGRTKGGATFHIPACVVVSVADGKVVRIDEYANVDRAKALLQEIFNA